MLLQQRIIFLPLDNNVALLLLQLLLQKVDQIIIALVEFVSKGTGTTT